MSLHQQTNAQAEVALRNAVEVQLKMADRIGELEKEIADARAELERAREALVNLETACEDFLGRIPDFNADVIAKINGRKLNDDTALAELQLDTDELFNAMANATKARAALEPKPSLSVQK